MNQSKLKYTNLTTLPNSFLTEQAILNILFLNPFLIKKIISSLPIQSFYFEPHKLIYQTLCELCERKSY
jgi:replicative DNA helicase